MSVRRPGGRLLAAIGAVILVTACASVQPELNVRPTPAQTPSVIAAEPTIPFPDLAAAAPPPTDAASPREFGPSTSPANQQRGGAAASDSPRNVMPPHTAQTALRLPVAADLGPNYFELFALASDAGPAEGHIAQVSLALVGFGFSERAKLRDERVERDGPLAAVARVTVHPNAESASRFAAASATEVLTLRELGSAANALGLTAALAGSPPINHKLAPDLTATRALQSGWFAALDGTRTSAAIETWTAARDLTVLTVVLVWRRQANDGWGESLLKRLVQGESTKVATYA